MKLLVIYSTKNGVSRHCAQMLCEQLDSAFEITLCDINDGAPPPDGFDIAVIGGSIRMSRLDKRLKAYMRTHTVILNNIPCAVFICCGYSESFEDYVHYQIPRALVPSLGIHYFGGELKPDKLRGLDKLIVRSIRSEIIGADFECSSPDSSPLPEIIPENIRMLAERIRGLL